MNKSLLFLIIFLLIGTSAAGGYFYYTWPTSSVWLSNIAGFDVTRSFRIDTETGVSKKSKPKKEAVKTQELAPNAPTFDVVNIVKEGGSVFAGRAEPGATVTVIGNGKVMGTVKADENGEWVLVLDEALTSQEYRLDLTAKLDEKTKTVSGASVVVSLANGVQIKPVTTAPNTKLASNDAIQSAKKASAHLLKNLQNLVEGAKKENGGSDTGSRVASVSSDSAAKPATIIPVPIQFVYRQAAFTANGRKAVGLLLDYVRLKRFDSIKLSGHADRRGTKEYNMGLSELRLQAVKNYLEEGGYKGKIVLVPKGESEPFTEVDRSSLPIEELYQLDRRVELHVNE